MALSEGIWGTEISEQLRRVPGLLGAHLAVWLDAVLEAVQLPARVADLAARLADVDGDALALQTRA